MKKITIKTQTKQYHYYSGTAIAGTVLQQISKKLGKGKLFIAVDEHVLKYHRAYIAEITSVYNRQPEIFTVVSGEKAKSFTVLQKLLKALLSAGCGRDTLLLAIGGGVTGDLAAFAASIYKRGIQVVHVPTTLLSMIDSSVGGKTGINFEGLKNIIGTFYQPDAVIADTIFLDTLPVREFNSGLGEAVKYAFLGDLASFNLIMRFISNQNSKHGSVNKQLLTQLIGLCVAIKAQVVEQDEHETGLRKILNLGHTFAHAIETVGKYTIYHGEAVAAGTEMALHVSGLMGILDEQKVQDYIRITRRITVPDKVKKMDAAELITAMRQDKKNASGEIRLVLVKDIGELLIDVPAPDALIARAVGLYNR